MKVSQLLEEPAIDIVRYTPKIENVLSMSRIFEQYGGIEPFILAVDERDVPARRVRKSISPVGVKTTRTDREPRDTLLKYHHIFDDAFNQLFGHRYRTSSVMCAPNPHPTYGMHEYVVLPIGNFKVCYSPKVKDLTDRTDIIFNAVDRVDTDIANMLLRPNKIWFEFIESNPQVYEKIIDEVAKGLAAEGYKEYTNIKEVYNNIPNERHETMIACSQYGMIKREYLLRWYDEI